MKLTIETIMFLGKITFYRALEAEIKAFQPREEMQLDYLATLVRSYDNRVVSDNAPGDFGYNAKLMAKAIVKVHNYDSDYDGENLDVIEEYNRLLKEINDV